MKRKTKTENNVIPQEEETKKYTVKLITKTIPFQFGESLTNVTVTNRVEPGDFAHAVGLAMSFIYNEKDESYKGYQAWAREFAMRVALMDVFTDLEISTVGFDELWFFVFYSPVYDMIMDICPDEASCLRKAIDDAVDIKKSYLIHKSDMIELIAGAINKMGDLSKGFENLDMGALATFLDNAQGLQGSELIQAILGSLGDIFGGSEEEDEVVIGSQKVDAKKK